jgi:hypothetical protein
LSLVVRRWQEQAPNDHRPSTIDKRPTIFLVHNSCQISLSWFDLSWAAQEQD